MEKSINEKIHEYCHNFKIDLIEFIEQISINESDKNKFKNFINSYSRLEFQKNDFVKRKRVKKQVPDFDRCKANVAHGTRCSRKKKENEQYCGTHSKGQPNGIVTDNINNISKKKKFLTLKQIKGIDCWIDDHGNVYSTEDIFNGIENPRVVYQYKLSENGEYIIKS